MSLDRAESLFGQYRPSKTRTMDNVTYDSWPVSRLITSRRADIAIKFRYFQHLIGGGDEFAAQALYVWHIVERSGHRFKLNVATDGWKRNPQDYLDSAGKLLQSMTARGYCNDEPILVDNDGEIWNGAHRIACAAAMGFTEIPVFRKRGFVWAPRWDREWMVEHGISAQDLKRLDSDMEKLKSV